MFFCSKLEGFILHTFYIPPISYITISWIGKSAFSLLGFFVRIGFIVFSAFHSFTVGFVDQCVLCGNVVEFKYIISRLFSYPTRINDALNMWIYRCTKGEGCIYCTRKQKAKQKTKTRRPETENNVKNHRFNLSKKEPKSKQI